MPKYLPQHPFLKHPQPISFLSVNDQASHQDKTTGKITAPYVFIFILLDIKLEDKKFCTEW
jgi:hypothetical protein